MENKTSLDKKVQDDDDRINAILEVTDVKSSLSNLKKRLKELLEEGRNRTRIIGG